MSELQRCHSTRSSDLKTFNHHQMNHLSLLLLVTIFNVFEKETISTLSNGNKQNALLQCYRNSTLTSPKFSVTLRFHYVQ